MKRLLGLLVPIVLGASACSDPGRESTSPPALRAHEITRLPSDVTTTFVDFGSKLHLIGHTLTTGDRIRPGERLELTLYFRSVARLSPGFRLTTSLIAGRRIDSFESGGPLRDDEALGPAAFRPGKIYADRHAFEVPTDLEAKQVTLAVSLSHRPADPEPAFEGEVVVGRPTLHIPVLSGLSDGQHAIVAYLHNDAPDVAAGRGPQFRKPPPRQGPSRPR